jgi:hypothetical protein
MASSVASTSSASSLVLPPRVLPELRAVPPNLPFDVLAHIFDFLLLASSTPLTCLLISRDLTRALRPRAHQNVVLSSLRGLDAFAELLERDPAVARRVRAIWIAPLSVASDLVPALSPAAAGRSPAAIRAHTRVRSILRSCRKLRHLALDGGFVSQEAARAFGTACKPETLFAINPQSYVGGFSAPMFARCRRLHMCDGSLTHEEIDEIRAMPGECCHEASRTEALRQGGAGEDLGAAAIVARQPERSVCSFRRSSQNFEGLLEATCRERARAT